MKHSQNTFDLGPTLVKHALYTLALYLNICAIHSKDIERTQKARKRDRRADGRTSMLKICLSFQGGRGGHNYTFEG